VLNSWRKLDVPVVIAPPPAAVPVPPEAAAAPPTPFVNSIGMWLLPVEPGEFVMGSPPEEEGHDPDETQHKVRLTKPFLLGVFPVTQSQYAAVMGNNPSYFRGEDLPAESRGDLPVESVSWDDAVAFCKKLSEKEGRTYRLPTEAEREYACRAGSTGPYAGDGNINDIGWYLWNSGDTSHPVGMLQSNDWGFYDMQGNVWEWCSDWYGAYPPGDAVDPTGPATGESKILRGGSLSYGPEACRSAYRNYYPPDERIYYIGFRVALDSP
jgi:formylglycine-generating enzyme required for sulfatase activity